MKTEYDEATSGYRIGAVSKLTGISPDTLRVWERRYEAVTPGRSAGGGRLYAPEDIARLRLMKTLVDGGDSIGTVATLNHEQLQERVTESRPATAPFMAPAPCRLVVIGESLGTKMEAVRGDLAEIDLVASFRNPQEFQKAAAGLEADVLLIEQPTLQTETAVQLVDWLAHVNAASVLVVYRFAAQDVLRQLPGSRYSTIRGPVDPYTVLVHCREMMARRATVSAPQTSHSISPGEPAPPRRYDDKTLARLAAISSTVKCECPRHLAELITGLSAFERYSSECESRSPADAALHAYLQATASHARHLVETALTEVIEAENIAL